MSVDQGTSDFSFLTLRAAQLRETFDRSFVEPARLGMASVEHLLSIRIGADLFAIRLFEIVGLYADKKIRRVMGGDPGLLGIAGFRSSIQPVYGIATLLGRSVDILPRWLVISAGRARVRCIRGSSARGVGSDTIARCERQRPAIRPKLYTCSRIGSTHLAPAHNCQRDQGADVSGRTRKELMKMFRDWTVGRRLVTGFSLAGLTLVVITFVSYENIIGLIENDGWVEHRNRVRIELANLLSEMKDAETGQRGYLLTGSDGYLQPHETALRKIKGTYWTEPHP